MTLIPCTLIIGKTAFILLHHPISLKSENTVYHTIQKITVMRYSDNDTRECIQVIFQ